jgi:ABC-type methionine transport system ATPase subunit
LKDIRVRLEYPLARINEPVVTHLVKEFDVSPNVLAANIDAAKGGWMLLGLSGEDDQIDKALAWVRSVGVSVALA